MPEEGAPSSAGGNMNIGITVSNDALPGALQGISKEVEKLGNEFRKTQQIAAQGMEQTRAKVKETQQATQETGESALTAGKSAAEALGLQISAAAALQAAVSAIREEYRKLDEQAAASAEKTKALGAAGNARPGFSSSLRNELRGTMYADVEGSRLASGIAAEAPRAMSPEQLGALMKESQNYVGLMGSREGAAGIAKDAAVIFDKFGGKISPEQANAYAVALRQAGMQNVAEWNEPVQKLITAGMTPEKAFGVAAGAAESDLGDSKMLKSLATLIGGEVSTTPLGRNPSAADQLSHMPADRRLEAILARPESFGFEGRALRDMLAATNAPTVEGAYSQRETYMAGGGQFGALAQQQTNEAAARQAVEDRSEQYANMNKAFRQKITDYYDAQTGNPLASLQKFKALARYSMYDDPVTGALAADPRALGLTAGIADGQIGFGYHSRVRGPLRDAALVKSGLLEASGETILTRPGSNRATAPPNPAQQVNVNATVTIQAPKSDQLHAVSSVSS